jgi:hypothetical protein
MVPYADFNLLKFTDKDQALSKIMANILPNGFRECQAGLVAGAGPVATRQLHLRNSWVRPPS